MFCLLSTTPSIHCVVALLCAVSASVAVTRSKARAVLFRCCKTHHSAYPTQLRDCHICY
jgi:hypothetical protein